VRRDTAAEHVRGTCIEPAKAMFPDDYDNCEDMFMNCISDEGPQGPSSCR
jgi:hypothetical protein